MQQVDELETRPTTDCSVVVATFNRSMGLRRLLEALKNQTIGPNRFEVIVVDDGSTDSTSRLLSTFTSPYRLRWFRQRNQGPAAARNAAIEAAIGDIIVTLDDDVIPAPDLLELHLAAHTGDQALAVIGRFAPPEDIGRLQPWVAWEFAGLERQYQAMTSGRWAPTPRQFYTANSSVPRWAYLKAGMFDPLFRRAEDVELAYRLQDIGLQFRFLPEAVIQHSPDRTFEGWQRIASQYGFYDVIMWRHKGRSHLIPLMGHEFRTQRPRILQMAARVLVGRKLLIKVSVSLAGRAANTFTAMGLKNLSMPLYSAIFNLLYWQGMTQALGKREHFLAAIAPPPEATDAPVRPGLAGKR